MKKTGVFAEALKNLQDVGFWPRKGDKIPFIFSSPFFIIGMFKFVGLLGHIYKSFSSGRNTELVNDIFFLVIAFFAMASSVMFYIQGDEAMKFYRECHRYVKINNAKKVKIHLDKMTNFLYYYSAIANAIFLIFTYFNDQECYLKKAQDIGEGYICGLMFPAWFPIDLDYTLWKLMIHLLEVYYIIYIIPKLACSLVFFYGGIVLIQDSIGLLKNFLKEIQNSRVDSEEITRKLKFVIINYSDITRMVHALNSSIGIIFSPSQHVILGLLISLLEFQAVVEKKGNVIPSLIFWFLFESLTCWKGQSLEDASVSLAEQLYEFPWYDLHPSARSIFEIFYGQVQITLQLKCAPIITINFAYFYEVMKGSYSVLMFLQKMY